MFDARSTSSEQMFGSVFCVDNDARMAKYIFLIYTEYRNGSFSNN